MYCQCVILLLTIFIAYKFATEGTNNKEVCGVLSGPSAPVEKGYNVTIVYTPNTKYLKTSRQWTRIEHRDRHLMFDSATNSSTSTKIFEGSTGNENNSLLIIQNVTFEDAGNYYVICGQKPIVYSSGYQLKITKVVPGTYATTMNTIATSTKDIKRRPSVVNNKTSTRMRDWESVDKKEVVAATYATTKNTIATSAKYVTKRPAVVNNKTSTRMSDDQRADRKEVSRNQENVGVTTKRIPVDTSTEKAHEATVTPDIASDEMSHTNENVSIPVWVTVVIVVAVVAVLVVIVAVVRVLQKRKDKHPNGSQECAHYSRSDKITEMTGQTDEIPEYAKVIPKEHRKCEAKQETCKKTTTRINNTETNNQLVYAELDLQTPGTVKQNADQYKATEYVTVDFTETGTIRGNESNPENNKATEYVSDSVDFTKTGTSQGNQSTPATEYVSVDFTKTGTTQGN